VVADIPGVVKLFDPLNNKVPPVNALYQSMVSPAPGVAVNVTVPVPQRATGVTDGATGNGLMVAVTKVVVLTHPCALVTVK